jgi:cytochrome c-type biogenesis protein CcmF
MITAGQYSLLLALLCASFAGFMSVPKPHTLGRRGQRYIDFATGIAAAATTLVVMILATALIARDFRFAYVAQYTSRTLPWYYALSSLWVGQAGSLLLWAWFSLIVSLIYRVTAARDNAASWRRTMGLLLSGASILLSLVVFVADPCAPSLIEPQDGTGLSPSLQHPAMLIHPPMVFLGYALWSVPAALAITAATNPERKIDWLRESRPWGLAAWLLLGAGIMLGARWAYQELGWGGYWSWDPVENGSFLPWLIGTAAVHAWMVAGYTRRMQRAARALTISTFAACLFSSFLTRSGIFSSLHAFSSSSLGWIFLVWMFPLLASALVLAFRSVPSELESTRRARWSSRENVIGVITYTIIALAIAICIGTLSGVLSPMLLRHKIVLGVEYYNGVLIPAAIVILTATAAAPLLRWGGSPLPFERRLLFLAALLGVGVAWIERQVMLRPSLPACVDGLFAGTLASFCGAIACDYCKSPARSLWERVQSMRAQRRKYGGFVVHVGLLVLASGIASSSLGRREHQVVLPVGDSCEWYGYVVRLREVEQRQETHELAIIARLEIERHGKLVAELSPSQNYYHRQREWTTESSIYATWQSDLYTLFFSSDDGRDARIALIHNPRVRWIWAGGCIMGFGAMTAAWPARRPSRQSYPVNALAVGGPHFEQRPPVLSPHTLDQLRV